MTEGFHFTRPGPPDGAALLDAVRGYLARFVAFPSEHELTAATLWAAHAHAVDAAESSPRLAALSPEPASGKTRLLEVLAHLVPHPMHAINASPAAIFRAVKDLEHRPTILFDEIDTVFGPKAKENEETRALLNAGHRRGAVAYRCVGEGTKQKVTAFPAYSALAVAGLGDLPDTIMSRAVIVRMRRRARHEPVEAYRERIHGPEGDRLAEQLAEWAETVTEALAGAWPTLPEGITDRPADVWEPLLAIAEAAGGDWPDRARAACVELVAAAESVDSGSLGIRLLADLRAVFTDAVVEALPTETILERLRGIEDAPWNELRAGKGLDARGLARRLRTYGTGPHQFRDEATGGKQRGYSVPGTETVGGLRDPWARYLPPLSQGSGTAGTAGTAEHPRRSQQPPLVPDDDGCTGTNSPSGTDNGAVTCDVPAVPAVPDFPEREPEAADGSATCRECGQLLLLVTGGRDLCEACRLAAHSDEEAQ
ncbi:MAG: DUF3631 domain-containing protein [Pseudonocardiaceae bacterium]|nr:DUF3631 domain-containing protein [Pseudonocardiaceae bacterium]